MSLSNSPWQSKDSVSELSKNQTRRRSLRTRVSREFKAIAVSHRQSLKTSLWCDRGLEGDSHSTYKCLQIKPTYESIVILFTNRATSKSVFKKQNVIGHHIVLLFSKESSNERFIESIFFPFGITDDYDLAYFTIYSIKAKFWHI